MDGYDPFVPELFCARFLMAYESCWNGEPYIHDSTV